MSIESTYLQVLIDARRQKWEEVQVATLHKRQIKSSRGCGIRTRFGQMMTVQKQVSGGARLNFFFRGFGLHQCGNSPMLHPYSVLWVLPVREIHTDIPLYGLGIPLQERRRLWHLVWVSQFKVIVVFVVDSKPLIWMRFFRITKIDMT